VAVRSNLRLQLSAALSSSIAATRVALRFGVAAAEPPSRCSWGITRWIPTA